MKKSAGVATLRQNDFKSCISPTLLGAILPLWRNEREGDMQIGVIV